MGAVTVLALVAGLVLLAAGGESLVRGASELARTVGMSSLMVGLTVVSFATSAPELAVSAGAALGGHPGLALGNVVGSNIANVLLVLGLSALAVPLLVQSRVVRADIPVMALLSAALVLLCLDGNLSRTDGLLLVTALVAYIALTVATARRRPPPTPSAPPGAGSTQRARPTVRRARPRLRKIAADVAFVALGTGLLVVGARLLVGAASQIAAVLGVSDLVVGLTVVAVGTSLPELATSVIAVIRGERDLAVGNIVGSNVFNIGAVLGVTAVIAPGGIGVAPQALRFDLPVMLAVSLLLLPVAFTKFTVSRWEGGAFTGFYCAYIGYLVLEATGHAALGPYGAVMLFIVPITALWLVLLAAHEIRLRRGPRAHAPPAGGPDRGEGNTGAP